jgi:hypothetical protein
VGFKAYRSFAAGTPYNQGGNPIVDQQRYEFMQGTEPNGIDEETGFIDQAPGDQKGDYVAWCSVGPFRNVPDGGSVQATIALGVKDDTYDNTLGYYDDYLIAKSEPDQEQARIAALLEAYRGLDNALAVQIAFDGIWEDRPEWPLLTNGHGRETALIAARGTGSFEATADCHDLSSRVVTELRYDWFDYDCDYCTGAYNSKQQRGMFHRKWNTDAPPPSPNTNLSTQYNFTDNPDRRFPAAGDHQITLAWDNLSEVTPNPRTGVFGFRGFKVWKVSGWTRPVGSSGPSDDDWALIGEFRYFNYQRAGTGEWIEDNREFDPDSGYAVCPKLLVPNYYDPELQQYVGPRTVPICLRRGDVWDRQSGLILRPDTTLAAVDSTTGCVPFTNIECQQVEKRYRYPVGRFRMVDREVKNGFLYFYSVTAFDSSASGLELNGRRSTSESEGISPQITTRTGTSVWVVPNPYRGARRLQDRPSAWDLTPNATDPTGTHIDFMGLPRGRWTIKIFTVSGDLVQTLRSEDPVNESLRADVAVGGVSYRGYNRQQDTPNDGQARWNLISRNGQDIVSGIYIFTVESDQGTQRGRFVVIR